MALYIFIFIIILFDVSAEHRLCKHCKRQNKFLVVDPVQPVLTRRNVCLQNKRCYHLSLAVDSTLTVVGLFRLLVRRSGTHCQMNSEIRRVISTASNSSLKQSCSALTSVTSALEVIFNVMRSINPRFTYLLTKHKSSAMDLAV